MKSKLFYFLLILFERLTSNLSVCVKYDHLRDCHFHNFDTFSGVTLVCAGSEGKIFIDDNQIICFNWPKSINLTDVRTLDFQQCRFGVIHQKKFFDTFKSMHTLIISDMEMENLQTDTFLEASNLLHLIASQNSLTEIPPKLFINADKLTHVDFSKNKIKKIDTFGFVGAISLETLDLSQNFLTQLDVQAFKDQSNLKMLNLSHNTINELDLRNLSAINLLALDVSKNNLTVLTAHTFDGFTKLKLLNLSSNPIGNLKTETLFYVASLEYLNLRNTNISSIRMGTFSNQHKLISLDLSENSLKKLDFDLFLPGVLSDLRSLDLSENQLTELTNYRNTLFPQINLLDIKSNQFNCSYLHRFMNTVKWENISPLVDPKTIEPRDTMIRGIKCEIVAQNVSTSEVNSKLSSKCNGDFYLIYISILMSAFFIMFLFLNRYRIFKTDERVPDVQPSFANQPQLIQLDNEDLLLDC